MRAPIFLIAGLAWLLAGAASGQSLSGALDQLRTASAGLSEPSADVARLRTALDRLDAAAASLPPAQRADYAKSLAAQGELLTKAATEPDKAKSAEMVRDVAADLELKVKARGFGAATTLVGLVKVNARTRQGEKQVSGLSVGASPVALAGRADPMFVFPQLSSPTTRDLPPGRYEFVLKQDGAVIARQRADVGLTSTEAVTLDLVVPRPAPVNR